MKLAIALALCLTALVAVVSANGLSAPTTTPGVTSTTTPNGDGTTTTTVTGTSNGTTTDGTTTNGAATNGTPAEAMPPSASVATGDPSAVLDVVEITRVVPSGTAAVTAFTVPTGQTLVVTDVLVTNAGAAAVCGAAVNRVGVTAAPAAGTPPPAAPTSGAPTPGAPPPAAPGAPTSATAGTTVTQSDSTITGPLCVGATTTMSLPLTTGIEFGPGQTVQLLNAPDPAAAATTPAAGAVAFHLRGVLIAS
jgi:hypothetical protein